MARNPYPPAEAREVQGRLDRLIKQKAKGKKATFCRQCGLAPSAADHWDTEKPTVPDTATLRKIAKRHKVSLDWLLFGKEPAEPDLWSAKRQLYDALMAELSRRGGEYRGDPRLHRAPLWHGGA